MRRRLAFAGVLVAAVLGAATARADWQVHRDGSRALVDRAEQALRDRPDDDALARRLVQIAGRKQAAGLRERFRARAAGSASYGQTMAYAQVLLALGDGPAAATAFSEALRVSPDAPAALAGRARALALTGSSEALGAYEAALEREVRLPARRRLIEAELALLASTAADEAGGERPADLRGQPPNDAPERVVRLRRELARLTPESDRAAEQLADALARAGRPGEAAAILEQRVSPRHLRAKVSLVLRAARLRVADGDASDAARAADTVSALLHELPRDATESRRAAWACARELARVRGTLGALAESLALAPGPVEWELLGQVREELGDLEGALAATRRAAALAPHDVAVGDRLLRLLDRLGRDEEAILAAGELAHRFPSEIKLSVTLCERQWRHGDRTAAEASFDRALARFSREPTALQTLAETAARLGDDKRALAAWTRLVRVDPTSEVAVVGLGEAQFQSGKRDDARRTWATVLKRAASPAKGHLRLGELLFDHDLLNDAIEEAQRAQAADVADTGPHRLLAQIDERQRKLDDAVAEWRRVLTLAHEPLPGASGLRREAWTRILALLARQGRGKVDAEVHRLRTELSRHPDDAETAMFLAEAEQRLGDTAAARATLQAIVARAAGATDERVRESGVDAGFALVRLFKQSGQLVEAAAHLGELAQLSPARAVEAELQIADIALGRYDLPGALTHAARAEAGADPHQLIRIAEIRDRAGAPSLAAATYRKAVARGAAPTATLALARVLERQGDVPGAAGAVEALLRDSRDDASVADAARRALGLDEALDRLPELAEALAQEGDLQQQTPARRQALVDVLERVLPALYRDPAADGSRARLGRLALRPLLDAVLRADVPPRRAVELLGMLGNADAAPALARIASSRPLAPANRPGTASGRPASASSAALDARAAAVVALGRLGDPRGLAALEEAATSGAASMRASAIWAIGRTPDQRVGPLLEHALEDSRPDLQTLACLGLGRHANARSLALLARLGADAARPDELRIAAALALGRAGGPQAASALISILDGGDRELSRAAAVALAWTHDPRAVPVLLARALSPTEFALSGSEAPLAALAAWQAGGRPPDEARSIVGNELSVPAMLAVLVDGAPAGDLTPLWRAHTSELDAILSDALARGGSARRAALEALDARADGPALGALAPMGDAPIEPETAVAAREVAWPLADGIAAALDDPDRRIRALTLRVLSKLGDERLTPARLAEAVADGSPLLADAALSAAQILVHARPGLATPIAGAMAPLVFAYGSPGSWSCRLAAVQLLGLLGPPGLPLLERAVNDRNALVRAAALEAIDRARPSRRPPSPG